MTTVMQLKKPANATSSKVSSSIPSDELVPADETELLASVCRESFYEFVKEFWDVIIAEEPVWNWHIKYLCDQLQNVAERVFEKADKEHDLLINISPGSTKSTICSVMFPAWVWTRMPTARTICASYAYTLAMDLSRKCRDIINSDERFDKTGTYLKPGYRQCFPEVQLREDQNTKGYFANTLGGMRYSVGTGGTVTGMHGHFLIVDDPLNPQEAASESELKTANEWMNETLPSRCVNKAVTPLILIQQRLHQNDPTGNRLEKGDEAGKVKHICLPADCTEYEVIPRALRRKYVDGLMDPIRLSRQVLRETRARLGEYGYAGQYGQSPVPRGGGTFEVEKLKIATPPRLDSFRKLCRFWDKAATHESGDWTVGALLGLDANNQFWVLDIIRGQWGVHQRETTIRHTAELDGRAVVIGLEQEPGSGGKESAQATVRRLMGFKVKIDKPTGAKEDRAEPFAGQVGGENVLIAAAPWNAKFIEELRFFPKGTHDDQVDAASGAFNLLANIRRKVGAL